MGGYLLATGVLLGGLGLVLGRRRKQRLPIKKEKSV